MHTPPDARQAQVLRHHSDVVSSRLGDAGVLVNLRTNRILELNATGIRIWELIGEGLSMNVIADRLRGEFDVTAAEVAPELARLVDELVREGLVDAVGGD